MNKTLAVIIAAAGIAGCARSAPYYSQSEIVEWGADNHLEKYVSSSRDRLRLGYVKTPGLFHPERTEWLRVEVNKVCDHETVHVEYGPDWAFVTDDGCNGTVDKVSTNVNGYQEYERSALTEENAFQLDAIFAYVRDAIDRGFDIDRQIEEWRERHE